MNCHNKMSSVAQNILNLNFKKFNQVLIFLELFLYRIDGAPVDIFSIKLYNLRGVTI